MSHVNPRVPCCLVERVAERALPARLPVARRPEHCHHQVRPIPLGRGQQHRDGLLVPPARLAQRVGQKERQLRQRLHVRELVRLARLAQDHLHNARAGRKVVDNKTTGGGLGARPPEHKWRRPRVHERGIQETKEGVASSSLSASKKTDQERLAVRTHLEVVAELFKLFCGEHAVAAGDEPLEHLLGPLHPLALRGVAARACQDREVGVKGGEGGNPGTEAKRLPTPCTHAG
eukprot:scaffold8715_cov87-Isochrysis_galbana.AAC.2